MNLNFIEIYLKIYLSIIFKEGEISKVNLTRVKSDKGCSNH